MYVNLRKCLISTKNFFLLIFVLSSSMYSQDNWSSAKQLSIDGVHPYNMIGIPAITLDHNGTIYAFWVISPEEDGGTIPWEWYSQIEYRRSTDAGQSWSATENLTPEYSNHRINYMRAVCDSENNVHLIYMRGSEGYEVLYKKFDGISWTEPELIGYGSSYLRMNIDSDDRIYASWMIGREAYFAYCEDGIWSDYAQIGSGEYGIDDIKFDRNNILIAIGACYTDVTPYLFVYNKEIEAWSKIEEMPNDTLTTGCACAISEDDTLFINNTYSTYARSKDLHLSLDMLTDEYSKPYEYGDKNSPEREMYIDQHDYLHLFELHFYVYANTNEDMGLTHSIGKNSYWETTVIDSSDENYSYSEPNVAFDKINNKFYLLYNQSDKINSTNRIFFRSKQNTTGIEQSDGLTTKGYELYQNYPNPFNNSTKISYYLSQASEVKLNIYNVKGELTQNLINRKQNKGRYSVLLEANNLNSGIYYYRLEVDGVYEETRKMLYLK